MADLLFSGIYGLSGTFANLLIARGHAMMQKLPVSLSTNELVSRRLEELDTIAAVLPMERGVGAGISKCAEVGF